MIFIFLDTSITIEILLKTMNYVLVPVVIGLNLWGFNHPEPRDDFSKYRDIITEEEKVYLRRENERVAKMPLPEKVVYCLIYTYKHTSFLHLYWNMINFTVMAITVTNLGVSPVFIFLTSNISSVIAFLIYTRRGDRIKGFSAANYSINGIFVFVVFKSSPVRAIGITTWYFMTSLYDWKYGNKRTSHSVHLGGFILGLFQCMMML
jgi:hypothetical protein